MKPYMKAVERAGDIMIPLVHHLLLGTSQPATEVMVEACVKVLHMIPDLINRY